MRIFCTPLMLLFVLVLATTSRADDRPNVIVFYTDDHGHADLSCQGVVDDIRTPHVDALAGSGILQAWLQHVTAMCSVTCGFTGRASSVGFVWRATGNLSPASIVDDRRTLERSWLYDGSVRQMASWHNSKDH